MTKVVGLPTSQLNFKHGLKSQHQYRPWIFGIGIANIGHLSAVLACHIDDISIVLFIAGCIGNIGAGHNINLANQGLWQSISSS